MISFSVHSNFLKTSLLAKKTGNHTATDPPTLFFYFNDPWNPEVWKSFSYTTYKIITSNESIKKKKYCLRHSKSSTKVGELNKTCKRVNLFPSTLPVNWYTYTQNVDFYLNIILESYWLKNVGANTKLSLWNLRFSLFKSEN